MVAEKRISKQAAHDVRLKQDEDEGEDDDDDQDLCESGSWNA